MSSPIEAPREPSETSLRVIRDALADHAREVSAGRWFAFGSLLLFAVGFGAVTGITVEILRARFGLRHELVNVLRLGIFVSLASAFGIAGAAAGAAPDGDTRARAGRGWDGIPGSRRDPPDVVAGRFADALLLLPRLFVTVLGLACRRNLRPNHGLVRLAAALLDAESDPSELAHRGRSAARASVTAVELLESLGLIQHRSLRRIVRAAGAPDSSAPNRAPELGVVAPAPRLTPSTAVDVHGVRERWRSSGVGAGELQVAVLSGTALVKGSHALRCVDVEGRERWKRELADPLSRVELSADGERIALLDGHGRILLLDARTGGRAGLLDAGDDAVCLAITAGGDRLATGDRIGNLRIFGAQGETVGSFRVDHAVDFVALASALEIGVAASRQGHVTVFDTAKGAVRGGFLRAAVERLWLEDDGQRALILSPSEGVLAYDLASGALETYALDRPLRAAASDALGNRFVALTLDGSLVMLDAGARVLWQCDAPSGARDVRMNLDGSRIWTLDAEGSLCQLEVLDRPAAERRSIELAVVEESTDPVASLTAQPVPDLSGFRRVLVGRAGSPLVLLHPHGSVAVQRRRIGEWATLSVLAELLGDAALAGDGSGLALASDSGIRLVRFEDRSSRAVRFPAPLLAAFPERPDFAVATADGEIWTVGEGGERRLAISRDPISQLLCPTGTDGSAVWVVTRAGAVTCFEAGALERAIVKPGELIGPLHLAEIPGCVLIADPAGVLQWRSRSGELLSHTAAGVAVMDASAAGPAHVALSDRLGNLHLAAPNQGLVGSLPRPRGVHAVGADSNGVPWVVQADRELLTCVGWDGSIRARFRVGGSAVDLAATQSGGLALLTTDGLYTHGLEADASNARAQFLEL